MGDNIMNKKQLNKMIKEELGVVVGKSVVGKSIIEAASKRGIKNPVRLGAVNEEIVSSEWHNNLLIEKHSNGVITIQVGGRSNSMLNLGKGNDFKTLMKIIVDVSKRK